MKKRKPHPKKINLLEIINNEIKENSLRQGFSKNLLNYSIDLKKKESSYHKDFTNIPFVTIDGDDSKDFDDAIWSNNDKHKSKVYIAIADVSFYVEQGDPLDMEARKRGNSFYFPDRVIPMLPEEISNNLCSLKPNEKKKCVIIEVDLYLGKIQSFKIHRGIIKSIARLTYDEVDDIYFSKKTSSKYYDLIYNLFKTYSFLKAVSDQRGKINFDRIEFEIKEDKKENVILKKKEKLHSYRLIEEFMVLGNNIVGGILKRNNLKSIFRNHECPSNEKILNLKKIINNFNINFEGNLKKQKDFWKLKSIFKERNQDFLNDFLLKTQSKAIYENKNKGHFGLSLSEYTHFTSPIRRYSDLLVHRDLINFCFEHSLDSSMPNISSHLNIQEKKADFIERTILDKACSLYLKGKKKNFEFKGFVDAIESFGVFIKAIDYPFSGLVRFKKQSLKTSTWGVKRSSDIDFKVGQLVKFRIKKNNISNGKILLDKVKRIGDE